METVPNILAAIGTLVLAVAAFFTILQNKKQLNILSKQIRVQKSEIVPFLQVNSVDANGNSLTLNIENLSSSTARGVGISTRFYLVYPEYSADLRGKDVLSQSRLEQRIKENESIFVKYFWYGNRGPKLLWEGKNVKAKRRAIKFRIP